MQPIHNTLSENIRVKSFELLNKHLAAAIDLHAQVKQAHRNVRGPAFIAVHELYDFIATHKLFDKISTNVANYSGLITERVGGLGGTACGTIPVAMERSYLVPYPLGIADETQHIFAVSGTLAVFGQSLREAIAQATTFGDADTAGLFTKVSHGIDHELWSLNLIWLQKMNKTHRTRTPPPNRGNGSDLTRVAKRVSNRPSILADARGAKSEPRDRIEVWGNEGGARGGVNR